MFRVRTFAAVVVVAFGLALLSVSPASAHDELLSSSPRSNEQLSVAPEIVSLTFSADVLTMGAAIIVTDQHGRDWVAEKPAVSGATVTATMVAEMPDAGYEIRWRVVSADRHPISGIIPFTVGDAAPLTSTSTATGGSAATVTNEQGQNTREADQGALRVILIGAGGAAASVGAFALISLLRRRKPATTQPDGPVAPHE